MKHSGLSADECHSLVAKLNAMLKGPIARDHQGRRIVSKDHTAKITPQQLREVIGSDIEDAHFDAWWWHHNTSVQQAVLPTIQRDLETLLAKRSAKEITREQFSEQVSRLLQRRNYVHSLWVHAANHYAGVAKAHEIVEASGNRKLVRNQAHSAGRVRQSKAAM